MSQHTLTVNGGPTVVYTLTGGRQGPPGPDLVEDRAAIEAAAAAAAADAIATAADRVQTGLDAVATAADRVQTGLDRVATAADAAAADADALATAADRVQTGLDRVATGADAAATAADRVQTGLDRVATAADRVQTGLDRVATAADRVQTGLDRTQTGLDAIQTGTDRTTATAQAAAASGSALTAVAQASLAASSAASASSVAQQDLSGVTAAALHRSPNAVVAMCRYDTSLDSDGGAWVERCTNTSWFNEALNGTWLAATSPAGFLTELDARSRGATLGTEVSPDPTFSSSAGWTLNGSASIGSNTLTAASVGTGNAIATRSDPVGGNLALATAYQVTVVVGTLTAGAIQVRLGNTGTTLRTLSSAGTHTFTVNPGATGANMSLYASGTTSGTVTRFSIKPVTANVTATGDFFQLATDGKFYSLNAGSGTTEVFRGNKAKPGRLSTPVAEAASVSLYDLTESGRSAWMRFVAAASNMIQGTISGCAMLNGILAVASNSGLFVVNLAADTATLYNTSGRSTYRGRVSQRNAALGHDLVAAGTGNVLASNTVDAVAMCVMPDAPVDPVTGLQVPTIACFTGGGISIIQNDGTVRNSSDTSSYLGGTINQYMMVGDRSASNGDTRFFPQPGKLGSAFTNIAPNLTNTAAPDFARGTPLRTAVLGRSALARLTSASPRISLLRVNEEALGASLGAQITSDHSTGWMAGDIRRVWCADTVAGTVTATEKVTNGTFATDVTGWSATGSASVVAWDAGGGGRMLITRGTATSGALQSIATEAGKTYALSVTITNGSVSCNLQVGSVASGTDLLNVSSQTGAQVRQFTAVGATSYLYFPPAGTSAGDTTYIDNVSVVEVVADRCYKAKPATIYGTLTRTAVAAGAQLVAYSGFSASNYIQEPYSADLDFGTGAWTCSAWLNYATAVASTFAERSAASGPYITFGTTAAGYLTATAYDGTTTRTVTTAAAYNTSTRVEARASYTTDGTLSISVNGRVVASTYGTPLLTLSNASAVTTIGNSRALDAPFPGSIALVKWGATVPTLEQMRWMYEAEKQMFVPGAQVTLPDTGSLVDVAYDDLYDRITVVSAANESNWTGLVRTSTAAVPAGAFTKVARGSGVKLLARSTTNIGVDVTIPSQNLKEELLRRSEDARRVRVPMTFDYVGGFTANVTNGSTALASVAGLSVPAGVNLRGVTVTGTGIPASTVITDIVGSTVYISKAATATNTGVSISMLEFPLPTGYEAESVATDGTGKQEGSTKSWVRSYDGFTEKVVYGAAPGSTAWVQARARRQA